MFQKFLDEYQNISIETENYNELLLEKDVEIEKLVEELERLKNEKI